MAHEEVGAGNEGWAGERRLRVAPADRTGVAVLLCRSAVLVLQFDRLHPCLHADGWRQVKLLEVVMRKGKR